jgi:hypothetical protein
MLPAGRHFSAEGGCQKVPLYGMPPLLYFEGGGKNFCRNPRLPLRKLAHSAGRETHGKIRLYSCRNSLPERRTKPTIVWRIGGELNALFQPPHAQADDSGTLMKD